MNIISHFKQILEQNFNNFIKKYFEQSNYWGKSSNIGNYISFMTDLDSFNYSLITDIIKSYFEYIDEVFFNTSYRKNFCTSKGLRQLLKLRLLKINGKNIKEMYLNQLNSNAILSINTSKINFSIFDKQTSNYNPLTLINESVYSKTFDTAYFYTYK